MSKLSPLGAGYLLSLLVLSSLLSLSFLMLEDSSAGVRRYTRAASSFFLIESDLTGEDIRRLKALRSVKSVYVIFKHAMASAKYSSKMSRAIALSNNWTPEDLHLPESARKAGINLSYAINLIAVNFSSFPPPLLPVLSEGGYIRKPGECLVDSSLFEGLRRLYNFHVGDVLDFEEMGAVPKYVKCRVVGEFSAWPAGGLGIPKIVIDVRSIPKEELMELKDLMRGDFCPFTPENPSSYQRGGWPSWLPFAEVVELEEGADKGSAIHEMADILGSSICFKVGNGNTGNGTMSPPELFILPLGVSYRAITDFYLTYRALSRALLLLTFAISLLAVIIFSITGRKRIYSEISLLISMGRPFPVLVRRYVRSIALSSLIAWLSGFLLTATFGEQLAGAITRSVWFHWEIDHVMLVRALLASSAVAIALTIIFTITIISAGNKNISELLDHS